jgi:acetyl esterase/lipase
MSACFLDGFSQIYGLIMKASVWRTLMGIGLKLHHFAEPKSPNPNFEIVIPSRLSTVGGSFKLAFYVPSSYFCDDINYRFPVVVNYHGGGFTLGTERDDARWASAVVSQTNAVMVSVAYRLAPEYPFSVGVEDATDAVIYLAAHAEELSLDPHRISLSGFSAGGNFSFAVPLILYDLQTDVGRRVLQDSTQTPHSPQTLSPSTSQFQSSASRLVQSSSSIALAQSYPSISSYTLPRPYSARSLGVSNSVIKLTDLEPTSLETSKKLPDFTIVCIVAFYPPVDFRTSREDKRLTNPQPKKNLPLVLTDLFDQSYIQQSGCDLADPYLSPAAASDDILRAAYPQDIVLYTCEYDMLNAEGILFGERLRGEGIQKTVHGGLIKGAVHAFDRKPNPISFSKDAELIYTKACTEIKRVFEGSSLTAEERVDSEVDLTVLGFDDSEVEKYTDLEERPAAADEKTGENKTRELPKGNDLSDSEHSKESDIEDREIGEGKGDKK